MCRLVWSVVSLSRVSFAERRAFSEERARLRALFLGIGEYAPGCAERYPFGGTPIREGWASSAQRQREISTIVRTPYRRARRSHDRFFATFHSFIPLLLLSGKLQNGRKIHPEALWHRTAGFLFQKAAPPKKINNDGRIGCPGAGQKTNGLAQSALSEESECPFSCGRKTGLCSSFFPSQPQRVDRSRANVSRLGGTAPFGVVSIGRDKAKSRWVQ